MQGKSPLDALPIDHYEDAIDMLEHVYEKIDDAVYLWVVWSKTFGCHDEQEALKAILSEIVCEESDELYKRIRVDVKRNKDGIPQINAYSSSAPLKT